MKYTKYEQSNIRTKNRPFFAELLIHLNELIGDDWDIVVRVFRPTRSLFQNLSNSSHPVDLSGISKRTALILWGDEYSQVFPEAYYRAAGVVIKCYCPDDWKDRLVPVTDIALSWTPEIEEY